MVEEVWFHTHISRMCPNNQFSQTKSLKGMFDLSGECQCPSDAISDPGCIYIYIMYIYIYHVYIYYVYIYILCIYIYYVYIYICT